MKRWIRRKGIISGCKREIEAGKWNEREKIGREIRGTWES